jgi:hypothetical protein
MEALFPRWSNTAIRVALATILATLVGIPVALMVYLRTPWGLGTDYPIDQPVEFDHRHHVRDAGIECRYCHDGADRSAQAGLPPTSLCIGCHGQVWNDSPMLEPVRRAYFSGTPIPWNRVTNVPDFVFFDHSAHVTHGIGCETCHGRVDEMARVYQAKPITMRWCLSCHRNPAPNLRPPEAITQAGWVQESAEQGRRLAERYGVRRLTHCSTCHR